MKGLLQSKNNTSGRIFLDYDRFGNMKRLCVSGIQYVQLASVCVGGTPSKTNSALVRFPLEEMYARRLIRLIPTMSVDPNVTQWLNNTLSTAQQLVELQNMQDYPANYMNAEKLYEFQRVDVEFMKRVTHVLNANQMGTGKTVESAALIEYLQPDSVICLVPKSKLDDWAEEIAKWTSYKDISVIKGTIKQKEKKIKEDTRIKILTHASLRTKFKDNMVCADYGIYNDLFTRRWGLVLVDEAHNYKNSKTQQSIGVRKLICDRMNLITGTPMLNSPKDLWSLLNLLYPKRFTSYWQFVSRFCDLEENPYSSRPTVTGIRNEDVLQYTMLPFTLRRLKKDVMPWLPDKIHKTIHLHMEGKQLEMYKQMEKEMTIDFIDGTELCAPSTLAQTMRLRQLLTSPMLLGSDIVGIKLEALLDLLEDFIENKEKVVVFSTFKEFIQKLGELLTRRKVLYAMLHGGTPDKDREAAKKKFITNPDCFIFLGTIKAGGEGLNLQVASNMIFVDSDWVPGIMEQCEDRIHRDGQTKNPLIIKLHCPNTIDDDIADVLKHKDEMSTKSLAIKNIVKRLMKRRSENENS